MKTPYIDIHTHTRKPDALCVVSYGLGRDIIPEQPENPFSAGIHPWDAAGLVGLQIEGYLFYLETSPLAAIGEAGLDYIRGGDREKQKKVFEAQLDIASRRSLPVVVHCVKAYNDLFTIIRDYPQVDFILHGYTGSHEQTRQAIDAGCYFSFGPVSLESPKTVRSIKEVPAHRIFAETDESPAPISAVYERLAQIRKIEITDLAKQIEVNFNDIFNSNGE